MLRRREPGYYKNNILINTFLYKNMKPSETRKQMNK